MRKPCCQLADNALFFIVLWNDKALIERLRSCKNKPLSGKIALAIRAIEAGDHRIFSPYFWDAANIWA